MNEAFLLIDVEPQDAVDAAKVFQNILQPHSIAEFLRVEGARVLQGRAERRFDAEGDAASDKWKPLRFSTNEIRDDQGYPPAHPINERTGQLKNYMITNWGTTFSDGEGAMMDWPSPQPAGELFTKLRTAQTGKPAYGKFGATPKRPVIAIDATDMDLMMAAFAGWFTAAVSGDQGVFFSKAELGLE